MIAREKVLSAVRECIAKFNPPNGAFILAIDSRRITQSDGWWHVPIYPKPTPDRSYPFINAIADIECELQDKRNLKIDILPTIKE